MNKVVLSVVIPSYDEMKNLQKGVLDKVEHFLQKKKLPYEVIVIDDGSKDGSAEFVEEFTADNPQFKLIKNGHTGKAGAVSAGMLKATGEYIVFADMDQATPIEEINKLLPFFDEGYDIVIGSRSTTRKGSPLIRRFISRSNIILRKLIVGIPDISDTQCGFKMFRRDVAQRLFTKIMDIHHGYTRLSGSNVSSGFDVELLLLAEKYNYKVKEVPVKWLYVESRRVNPITDSIAGVRDLIRIRRNDMKGIYATDA